MRRFHIPDHWTKLELMGAKMVAGIRTGQTPALNLVGVGPGRTECSRSDHFSSSLSTPSAQNMEYEPLTMNTLSRDLRFGCLFIGQPRE